MGSRAFRMKFGIALVISFVYSLAAAWFYYITAKGEPFLEVSFGTLLLNFSFLVFLLWIVASPHAKKSTAADMVLITVMIIPAGVLATLLILFTLNGLGIYESYGLEYFLMPVIPFTLAYRTMEGKVTVKPILLALLYGIIAFAWGNLTW